MNTRNVFAAVMLLAGVLFYPGCATKLADSSTRRLVFAGVKSEENFQ